MTTPEQWYDAVRELADSYPAINQAADLADRLHYLARKEDTRRMAEHLRLLNVPEEQWGRLLSLHPRGGGIYTQEEILNVLISKVEEGRRYTGGGIAERIADQHAPDLFYCKTVGGWLTWSGTRWEKDPNNAAARKMSGSTAERLMIDVDRAEREADAIDKKEDKDGHAKATKRANGLRRFATAADDQKPIDARLSLAQTKGLSVRAEELDTDPLLLSTANKTLQLGTTVTARGHRRADLITRVTAANYDPEARSAEWEAFVAHVFPTPEVLDYAQKSAGSSLEGVNKDQHAYFLYGDTGSGKSTFCTCIGLALGDYASTFNSSLFSVKESDAARPDIIDALPARFLYTSELSERWSLSADQMKRLLGDEPISARGMASDSFVKRRPAFTPWISTNGIPTITGADQGLWRRLVVIPTGATIDPSKADKNLINKFGVEQRDAVLNWLIEGWVKLQREGLEMPDAVVKATMKLRDGLSMLDFWLSEETEKDAAYSTSTDDLWNAFKSWCTDGAVSAAEMGNKRGFAMKLSARGYPSKDGGSVDKRHKVRPGLRLKAHQV